MKIQGDLAYKWATTFLVVGLALAAACAISGCGGGQAAAPPLPLPPPPSSPASPALKSLSASSAVAGAPSFTLTLMGSDFTVDSGVLWGGQGPFAASFVSTSELNFTVTPDLTACPRCYNDAGTVQIQVSKSVSGGTLFSNPLPFNLLYPTPGVTSLVPTHVQAGAAPLVLALGGSGFFSDASGARSIVAVNGSNRPSTVVTGTQITAALGISDLASPGTMQITVTNPTPGGGTSPAVSFTVNTLTSNPTPTISSLSDVNAPVGWPGFLLTVNGTGFVAATVGQWNGLNRNTNVLSSSLLKSAIPLDELATAGSAQVNVFNSSPGGGASSPVTFNVKSVAPGAVGVIERSSVATDLTEADADSASPAMSADGRFAVFASNADNLVSGDTNGVTDIFLRDTCQGAPVGCAPSVARASVATDASQANGQNLDPTISANGRYIAFTSSATNLVAQKTTNKLDVFLRDTCFGASGACTPSTTLASGGDVDSRESFGPSLSADGRFVAFSTGFFGECDSYYGCSPNDFIAAVHDSCAGAPAGCTPSTAITSVANDGSLPNNTVFSPLPVLSEDGRFVTFQSAADNLVPNDTNGLLDVFLRDTCFGAPSACAPSTVRVSVANDGSQIAMNSGAFSISAAGRFVAFSTEPSRPITGPNNGSQDVFVRDTCFGAAVGCTPSTTKISVANDGSQSDGNSQGSSLSADGRFVAFTSDATNLVVTDTSPFPKVFIRDTCIGVASGCTPATIRLSVALDGTAANNQNLSPVLSNDARYAVFLSLASNLGPGDTNQVFDVFVARTGLP